MPLYQHRTTGERQRTSVGSRTDTLLAASANWEVIADGATPTPVRGPIVGAEVDAGALEFTYQDGTVQNVGALGGSIGDVLRRAVHNGTAYPARPAGVPAGLVEYVGPTQPGDWLDGDTWIETA